MNTPLQCRDPSRHSPACHPAAEILAAAANAPQ
jgi:hypothetical protein